MQVQSRSSSKTKIDKKVVLRLVERLFEDKKAKLLRVIIPSSVVLTVQRELRTVLTVVPYDIELSKEDCGLVLERVNDEILNGRSRGAPLSSNAEEAASMGWEAAVEYRGDKAAADHERLAHVAVPAAGLPDQRGFHVEESQPLSVPMQEQAPTQVMRSQRVGESSDGIADQKSFSPCKNSRSAQESWRRPTASFPAPVPAFGCFTSFYSPYRALS